MYGNDAWSWKKSCIRKRKSCFPSRYVWWRKNINNYYSSDVWNKFSEAVAKAKLVTEDEAINDLRVNDAYWGLFDSFTSLCAYNKLSGDVDFDGKVTVRDATWFI